MNHERLHSYEEVQKLPSERVVFDRRVHVSLPVEFRSENEKKAFLLVMEKADELMDTYNAIHPNYISADTAKGFLPEYTGQNAHDYERPSGALADILLSDFIERNKNSGGTILWTGGGTGSGKTDYVKERIHRLAHNEVIFDSTLSNNKRVNSRIEKGLENGFAQIITYTHRPVAQAFTDGVFERFRKGEQRIIPIKSHIDSHRNGNRLIQELLEKYADNPSVTFVIFDNSAIGQKPTIADSWDPITDADFDREKLELELYAYMKREYQNRKMTHAQYQEFIRGM